MPLWAMIVGGLVGYLAAGTLVALAAWWFDDEDTAYVGSALVTMALLWPVALAFAAASWLRDYGSKPVLSSKEVRKRLAERKESRKAAPEDWRRLPIPKDGN